MPLPGRGSQVPHPQWTKHLRQVASSSMTARVRITRPDPHGTSVFNETTGEQESPLEQVVVSILPARVSVARQVSDLNVRKTGEERLNIRRYLIQIPWDWSDITVKDVITVLSAEDPKLVGRELTVMDIQAESFEASRVLRCEVYQK